VGNKSNARCVEDNESRKVGIVNHRGNGVL